MDMNSPYRMQPWGRAAQPGSAGPSSDSELNAMTCSMGSLALYGAEPNPREPVVLWGSLPRTAVTVTLF